MLPGHILRNRYKIIKQLGSGSFGITYLAEDLDLPDHPLCVVKNLRQSPDPEELQAFIAFFNKEAKALYRLGNELDQIPRLFAHFEEAGEFYLVQEYIDGHDLSQEIFPGNKLSEAQVTQLLKEILEVLTIIHNKNIIHRDVKAQNLMRRNSDGKIVLIDFGTVKELSLLKANPQEQTNVSVIVGTNGYMPYEQSSGYPKLASDIYAVGMLGIYALTGVKPQELPKNPDTFEVIWQDKVSVSPALANMLDKMVRSNFKERYQTAGEALQGLTALSSTSNLAKQLPGYILRNRYKIIKQLGSGGFGITYLAEDLDLPDHPPCVVKNLRQSPDPEELQAIITFFNKEAKALYRLGNELDQIPRLFAHFQERGEFYLVQEYIDGHDLSQEIFPGNKLSEAQVTQLLKEILEVLTIIHNKNIIHRDVKAQNLMRRNSDGKIVLIDFGTVKEISLLKANPQEQTNVSVIVGTPGYIPIEQSEGYPKLSSDVYAVGMLGIYALTGIKPQELPKNPDTFEVIWRDKASVSPALANFLDKMVRYNFKERYQTAGEALQALTALSSRNFRFANQRFLISVAVVASLFFGIGLLFMNFYRQSTNNVQLACSEADLQYNPNELPKLVDNDDNKYYGKVKDKVPYGCGTLLFVKLNDKYQGEFNNGWQLDGRGTYTFNNGNKFIGLFNDNSYVKGKLIYNNGCQYEGEFQNYQLHGQGTCISEDGKSESGIWFEGKLEGKNKTCCY